MQNILFPMYPRPYSENVGNRVTSIYHWTQDRFKCPNSQQNANK